MAQEVRPAALRERFVSVDVLRGLTVALMILVNDPGDWSHVYWPLDHAEWNGWTLTDLVFPTFLFLVGCAIVFSTQARIAKGATRRDLAVRVVRRSAMILLLGWLLVAIPRFHIVHMRLYGVLPRIALCSLIAGLLVLWVRDWRKIAGIVIALLVGYWLLMRFVPVPGLGLPVRDLPLLDPDRNLAAWLDRTLHFGRLYEKTRDPEGLLSTLPAVATTLLGVLTGMGMRTQERAQKKIAWMLGAGAVLLAAGLAWSHWFPINKKLWTSSYVLLSAGWALLALAAFYWIFDVRRLQERSRVVQALAWPWLVFGSNAIAAFTISELFVKFALFFHVPHGEKTITVWGWFYVTCFARGNSTYNTSLAFAIVFVLISFLPIWLMWRRKIFIRL